MAKRPHEVRSYHEDEVFSWLNAQCEEKVPVSLRRDNPGEVVRVLIRERFERERKAQGEKR